MALPLTVEAANTVYRHVWLYDAFPLLLVFVGVYVLATWMIERRLDVRPVLFVGIGTGLGMIVNPYFPYNIVFAGLHILPKLFDTTAIQVGNEWYPYETAQLLKNSPLALAAFVSGTLALGLSGKRMDLRTAISFGLACLFGLMLFQSRRFIEYSPAISLVFAAFAWPPVFQADSGTEKGANPMTDHLQVRRSTSSRFLPWMGRILQNGLPALALLVVFIPGAWTTFNAAKSSLQSSKPDGTYANASAWLASNTPAGARVFQTDWDDFPRLFYYNTHNE